MSRQQLEAVVRFAYELSECPLCGLRQALVSGPVPPEELVKNVWRHHMRTSHRDEFEDPQS